MAWHPGETGEVAAPKKSGRQVQARPGTWTMVQSSVEPGGEELRGGDGEGSLVCQAQCGMSSSLL